MIFSNLAEFCQLLKKNQPILAIDFGTKKMGIAISSNSHSMALPLTILDGTNPKILTNIAELTNKHNCCAVVIGLPVNMDGSVSIRAEIVIKFANSLAEILPQPIYLEDERLTSRTADSLLKMAGLNRKQRNEVDDSISASLILESVLAQKDRLQHN